MKKTHLSLRKIIHFAPFMLLDNLYPVRPIWWMVVLFAFATLLLIPVAPVFKFVLMLWATLVAVRLCFLIVKIIKNTAYRFRYVRKSIVDEGRITETFLSDPPIRH